MDVKAIGQGRQIPLNSNNSDNSTNYSDVIVSQTQNLTGYEETKVYGASKEDSKNNDIKDEDVKKAVDKLNKFLEDNKTHAEYQFHDKLKNDLMIKIIDDNTGKVIREIPPKKILDMIAKMCEMVGIIVDKKA